MGVKIIVDSASDITLSYAERNNIGFVPLKTNLGGVEYRDGIDIRPDSFYSKLEANKELAHTSQVNAGEFAECFEKEIAASNEIVVITLSAGLSGTYQSACIAAADYPGKVFVINSLTATAGEQVLIERALILRDEGKTAEEIDTELDALRKKVRLFVRVETLEYLKRGGRISKTSALVGGLLNIKPVLTLNGEGKIETVGKARGIKASHKMMNDSIASCGGIDFSMPVAITYAGNLNDGTVSRYLEDSKNIYGDNANKIRIGQLGCVIGTHTGPGAIVVSFVPKA
ncbi:MAG: DegV family protein [Ruminococcaceae bacterium]|nr:DegV family protein [Oscillospiraceae bacterium]